MVNYQKLAITNFMNVIEVKGIEKSYGSKIAVKDLSFSVGKGEIFGLIGPNGAGKTTAIRVIMNILKPDAGNIKILGVNTNETFKNKVGYLPEERGLYKRMTVLENIVYLASLKGMDRNSALKRADELLEFTGMINHKTKKIEEISKGMAQIVQFIITIIHEPELIILDEPFSGLDPSNIVMLKNIIHGLKNRGRTIIMSTHRMNEVEELCDNILMINNGKTVLNGSLSEIKSKYSANYVLLDYEGELKELEGIELRSSRDGLAELVLDEENTPQKLLEILVGRGVKINRFQLERPSLNEIFLMNVGDRDE